MVEKKKMKKGFMDGYKTYDPAFEGFGNPKQWRGKFKERMNREEAEEFIKDESAEAILEMKGPEWTFYTFEALKSQFRKMIMKYHPDRGGDTKMAQKIIAAYTILKERFGEK